MGILHKVLHFDEIYPSEALLTLSHIKTLWSISDETEQVDSRFKAITMAAKFMVSPTCIIDPPGNTVRELPEFAHDTKTRTSLHRAMVLTRAFDAKAIALQRTGRLGTYASSLGQEAVSVGVASSMRPNDVLLPSSREHDRRPWDGRPSPGADRRRGPRTPD
jgi:hypothetical protein